jgi:hypothetical protein
VNIFVVCQTLYHDVASSFYANSKFALVYDPANCSYLRYSFVEVPDVLFASLGSQARWLRELVLDLRFFNNHSTFRGSSWWSRWGKTFDERLELFEITPLLRDIWNLNSEIDVSFTQSKATYSWRTTPDLECNFSAMSALFRSILRGQLRLREQRRLLSGVGIKCDGSGGTIVWGTLHRESPDSSPSTFYLVADHYYDSTFTLEDRGA